MVDIRCTNWRSRCSAAARGGVHVWVSCTSTLLMSAMSGSVHGWSNGHCCSCCQQLNQPGQLAMLLAHAGRDRPKRVACVGPFSWPFFSWQAPCCSRLAGLLCVRGVLFTQAVLKGIRTTAVLRHRWLLCWSTALPSTHAEMTYGHV